MKIMCSIRYVYDRILQNIFINKKKGQRKREAYKKKIFLKLIESFRKVSGMAYTKAA